VAPSLPPSLNVCPVYFGVFRFQANQAVTGASLTGALMSGVIGGVRIAANTISPIASAFKIKKVVIWPPTGVSTPKPAVWSWNTSNSAFDKDTMIVETMPLGVSLTRPLVSTPPDQTLASFWYDSGQTGNIAVYSADVGSVLDMHVDFTLSTNIPQFANITTTAAGSAGVLYYLPLDGTGTKWTTIGRPTIV